MAFQSIPCSSSALVQTLSYKSHCKTHEQHFLSDVTCLLHSVEIISSIFGLKCSCQATSARKNPDIRHNLWHSFWNISGISFDILSGILSGRFCVVEVRRGKVWSRARGWSPAGITLIWSLRWRFGGEHSDPELAVEVRRGTLWSWACGGGPAGNTLIRGLRWRSGGEHFDPELAVEVRRGTLWSRACGGGPAGNTLIWGLRWRSGGEHFFDPGLAGGGPAGNTLIRGLRWRSGGERFDPGLAVEVRRGTLWSRLLLGSGGEHCGSRACNGAPARSGGRRKEGRGGQADIKSKNSHLAGVDSYYIGAEALFH